MITVRFAPSPTGYLHLGGARTALFNWLYARRQGGKFILRIEDTDRERSRPEYLDEILQSLEWLKMDWDDIYYQSKRFDVYRDYAQRLLDQGGAYRADNGAIIFRVQGQEKIKVRDIIRGDIEFDIGLIKDQVLIKADGSPAYNFACVVDDALLGITHILRGDDHISNTPKQAILYRALGFKPPKFAHLPLILGSDGGRLSKRTNATAVSDYRRMGYLPEALRNYLLLLGWSPGGNQEVIDIQAAINKFELRQINKTAAVFDINKLDWLNGRYIKKYDPERLVDSVIPFLKKAGYIDNENFSRDKLVFMVKLFQGRVSRLADFADWAGFVFRDDIEFEAAAKQRFLEKDLGREFELLAARFEGLSEWTAPVIEEAFRGLVAELGLKAGDLVHPVRIALSGRTVGPGLFETIALLGKDKVIARLSRARQFWQEKGRE
ncbi:MAG: glutamate--tRNA ligase [Candidatus Omnitrophota bacterium]